MNSAMRRSDRYRALKDQGMSEAEIIKNFNTKDKIEVFSWDNGRPSSKVM